MREINCLCHNKVVIVDGFGKCKECKATYEERKSIKELLMEGKPNDKRP